MSAEHHLRRWAALLVVDQFGNLEECDGGPHPVETSDVLDEFVAEEPSRGFLGVPEVDIGCATVLLIDSESLLAKLRQALETPTFLVRDPLDAGPIEVVGVLELDDDT